MVKFAGLNAPRLQKVAGHLFVFLLCGLAHADPLLPYSTRTLPFAGWGTTIRGDIRTLGLAGATVGLADTFIASIDNPAGLAMTVGGVGLQITSNRIHDGQIQAYEQTIAANHLGGVITAYPWGFALGAWTPHREDQVYDSPQPGEKLRAEVYTREYRASIARVFLKDRLSLGVTLALGQGTRNLERLSPVPGEDSLTTFAVGASAGVMLQLPQRWLLGVNYSLPMRYTGDTAPRAGLGVSGFFQPIEVPYRLGAGLGWMPNRFFNLGFGLYLAGTNPAAALVSDDTRVVGDHLTIQPRLGAVYTWAEYREFEGKVMAGSYFEVSRIAGAPNRLHVTGGLETNPWVLNFGWGIDVSPGYANYIVSAGVNVIKLLRKLDIVATGYQPPQGGLLPRLTQLSDAGLARPLVKDWVERPVPGIIDTIKAVPTRIERKFERTRDQLFEGVTGQPTRFDEPLPSPLPVPKPKKLKKPRPRKRGSNGH